MASIRSYRNGAGGTSGATLATVSPLLASGNIYYVGNQSTGNSDSNTGLERALPLATSAQANTNASAGDTIVYLANHRETISTSVVLTHAGLSLIGEGTGGGIPRFTCAATIQMFSLGAAGILLDNLYFPASTAVPTARIDVSATGCALSNLQFDCGASDTVRALRFSSGAGSARVSGTRFTSVASGAAVGLEVASAMNDLTLDTVTFDGGSFTWADYALKGSAAISRLRAIKAYLFNGSHVLLPTGTTGLFNVASATGDSRIDWTP